MAADNFLKIDGVEGESLDEKHAKEIEVINFSFGGSNLSSYGAGTGSGTGKAEPQPFTFAHKYDKTSPVMYLKMVKGEHFPKAVLTCRKAGGGAQEFFKLTMKEFFITSLTASGGESGEMIEQVSASFADIEVEYKPQDEKGALGAPAKMGWDLKKNNTR